MISPLICIDFCVFPIEEGFISFKRIFVLSHMRGISSGFFHM